MSAAGRIRVSDAALKLRARDAVSSIARRVTPRSDPGSVRVGTVTAVSSAGYEIDVLGAGNPIRSLNDTVARVGGVVYMLRNRNDWFIVGLAGVGVQRGSQLFQFPATAANAMTVTITWPIPYAVTPVILCSAQVGANGDVVANIVSPTATGSTFRLAQRDSGVNFSSNQNVILHWQASDI